MSAPLRPLANRNGLALVVRHLVLAGACCPACGHGTRATSKRWAKCKQCGARVQRRTPAEVTRAMKGATHA